MPLLARMVACPLVVEIRPGAVKGLAELLNDSRISSLVATRPLVEMAGLAGPEIAACTRTGVGFDATSAGDWPNTRGAKRVTGSQ